MTHHDPRAAALRRLSAPLTSARAAACRELGLWDDEESLHGLVNALGDAEAIVRDAAWLTLLETGNAATVRRLIPLLRGEDALVRNNARGVLDRITSAAPHLIVELSLDPDPRLRVHAAGIMGGTGDHEFVPRLLELLADPEVNVCDAAIASLGLLRAVDAVAPLASILRRDNVWLQLSALQSLAKIGGPDATRALCAALPAADPDMREGLEHTLAGLRVIDALQPLAGTLEGTPDLRPTVLRLLLGVFAAETARHAQAAFMRPVLVAVAEEIAHGSTAGWDAARGLDLLVAARHTDAQPAVLRLLETGAPAERVAAVRAAGALGLHGTVATLRRLLDGADADLAREIRTTLGRLAAPPAETAAAVERARILLVDDSDVVRGSLQWMLRPLALDIAEATDGRDAIDKLKACPADLAIVDLNMPRMDGFTLVRTIRAGETGRRMPIVVLTTEDRDEDRRNALAAGADVYLVKPPPADLLRKTVWSLLGRNA